MLDIEVECVAIMLCAVEITVRQAEPTSMLPTEVFSEPDKTVTFVQVESGKIMGTEVSFSDFLILNSSSDVCTPYYLNTLSIAGSALVLIVGV